MFADTNAKMISKKMIAVACGFFVFSVGQIATFNAAEAQDQQMLPGFVRKLRMHCIGPYAPGHHCQPYDLCQKCESAVRQKGAGNSVRVQCVKWSAGFPCGVPVPARPRPFGR